MQFSLIEFESKWLYVPLTDQTVCDNQNLGTKYHSNLMTMLSCFVTLLIFQGLHYCSLKTNMQFTLEVNLSQ